MAGKTKGSQFQVDFGGIKLPTSVEKRIASRIQETVMAELARIDLKGDIRFRIPRKEWLGIWIDRINPKGPIGPLGPR